MRLILAMVLFALMPRPAAADPALAAGLQQEVRFVVELRGLPAGVLRVRAARAGASYSGAARLETTGLARLVRRLRFDATVQGRLQGGRLQPLHYAEDVDTGRRESRTEMSWRGGVPEVLRSEPVRPERPWHLDPADQADALDPMSVLLLLLSDVPTERVCRLDVALFDGRRRGQVTLRPDGADADGPRCRGAFRRVAGYSEDELAEGAEFPFRLAYASAGNGLLRPVRLEAESPRGTARLRRD